MFVWVLCVYTINMHFVSFSTFSVFVSSIGHNVLLIKKSTITTKSNTAPLSRKVLMYTYRTILFSVQKWRPTIHIFPSSTLVTNQCFLFLTWTDAPKRLVRIIFHKQYFLNFCLLKYQLLIELGPVFRKVVIFNQVLTLC